MNSLRSKIVIPFHTPFDALRRYAKVSAYGYPQHISWSKDQCEPYPTEGIKAIPAYLVAGVVVLASVHVTWIGVRKVVSFQKDPELQDSTGLTGLVLIMFQCSATAAAAARPHTRQFDFIGAYLNSVVVSISCLPIASGILNLIVPLRYPDSLVLRSVGILPPVTKMVISLVAVLLLAWHCIIMNFGAIIILSNVALMCHSPLAVSKFSTNLDLEIGFLYRYPALSGSSIWKLYVLDVNGTNLSPHIIFRALLYERKF
ncbi:hypothetical protein Fcan01_17945 [Folsomia candida]|uniref:Uncharacterized protein n=1 Tax=Folsomia candida TaxID=158441 RepID=A0A226DR34_FOLCA|nr:hypothetical protein Fcan01_17945 [Folsomia candida]